MWVSGTIQEISWCSGSTSGDYRRLKGHFREFRSISRGSESGFHGILKAVLDSSGFFQKPLRSHLQSFLTLLKLFQTH